METYIKKLFMFLLTIASLAACSKKSDDRAAARAPEPGVLGVAGNTPTCGAGQQAVGRIYENSNENSNENNNSASLNNSLSFEQKVKGLLSATVDPKFFGTISGNGNNAQNGVTLEGRLRYDGNGDVLQDQSNLKLVIYDSFVGQTDSEQKIIQPYPINFNAATTGKMNLQNNVFNVQFKDTYGEINLQGTVNGATVTGTISYVNYANVTGAQNVTADLGVFSIPTCAWIN